MKNPVGLVLLLLVAGFAAYAFYFRPAWVMGPLESAAESVFWTVGWGIVPIVLWCAGVFYLLAFRTFSFFRRWRLVLGTAVLLMAGQGALGFFHGSLPVIGPANYGGDLAYYIKGPGDIAGGIRVGIVALAAAWVLIPALSLRMLRGVRTGAEKSVSASAQAYQQAPVHRGVAKVFVAAVRGSAVAVKEYRERRQADALAKEVGVFLNTPTAQASTVGVAQPEPVAVA
ncbi:MAG: hypothetical protein WD533_01245, partial [Dehalococcoidia bacterium]